MYTQIIKLYKYIINLTPEKRSVALLLGMVLLFGFIAYYTNKKNEKINLEVKNKLIKELDTCMIKNYHYLQNKESLQNLIVKLKIDSAVTSTSAEIVLAQSLAKEIKEVEIKVKKQSRSLNNKLNKLNEK